MRDHYDFSQLKRVDRDAFFGCLLRARGGRILKPELAEHFPDDDSVNAVLDELLRLRAKLVAAIAVLAVSLALAALIDSAFALGIRVLFIWGAVSLLMAMPLLWRQPGTARLIMPALFIVLMVGIHLTPWNSRKAFLADFRSVRHGMTYDEVEAAMGSYIKGTGWPSHDGKGELKIEGSIIYRHATTGNYDSDWGEVRFVNGRVTETVFHPD